MDSTCSLEAADYVNSVMEGPSATQVERSPVLQQEKGRKRVLSGESSKQAHDMSAHNSKKPRENLSSDDEEATEDDEDRGALGSWLQAKKDQKETPDFGVVLKLIYDELQNIYQCLTERMDTMEKNLEKKISSKLTQIVDKRVNAESDKLRKEVDKKFSSLRDDVSSDVETLADKIDSIEHVVKKSRETDDRSLNVAILNLQESANENLNHKVNGLIKDGLKVRDIEVVKAVRKQSRLESKPGVTIATLRSASDKDVIMKCKARLKTSRNYSNVFIQHDWSNAERLMEANFRTLVDAVREGHGNIRFLGSRVRTDGRNSVQRHGERDMYINRDTRQTQGIEGNADRPNLGNTVCNKRD